jgi:nucleotide-binding universal stress UspA family protein
MGNMSGDHGGTPLALLTTRICSFSGGSAVKVLLATDGSEFSRAAVNACIDLIKLGNVKELEIVSVYEPQLPMPAEPFAISAEYYRKLDDLAEARAREAVEAAADVVRENFPSNGPEVRTSVQLGRAAQVIVDEAEKGACDLVIVGSHGRGFWGRLTLGSVSDTVVHHAPCSVLVVRRTGSKEESR